MNKQTERFVAFGFGVVFVIVLLVLAIAFPTPTPFQYTVFRIVLALAAGGVAGMIPGFLTVSLSTWLRAGGALAVFVVVYFYSPAALTGVTVKTEQEQEIEKPIVAAPNESKPLREWGVALLHAAGVDQDETVPLLVVSSADQLTPAILQRRYKAVKIDGVRARVPSRAVIVANEVEGERNGALVGTDFSVLARRLANVTVDASAAREPGADAGIVRLYVKLIENVKVLANGSNGTAGSNGTPGSNGGDGANGRDGDCAGFGGYRGADAGRPGGDAGDGGDGQPGGDGKSGGIVSISTIVNPISSTIDVTGGQGGSGGQGGGAGTPGRGGTGGRGCTGLGGSQPNQADGAAGKPGKPGRPGAPGQVGRNGEYRLQIIKSFDPIVALLKDHANASLHEPLQSIR